MLSSTLADYVAAAAAATRNVQQDGNIVIYDVLHSETVEVIAAHQNGPCRCVRLNHDNSQVRAVGWALLSRVLRPSRHATIQNHIDGCGMAVPLPTSVAILWWSTACKTGGNHIVLL